MEKIEKEDEIENIILKIESYKEELDFLYEFYNETFSKECKKKIDLLEKKIKSVETSLSNKLEEKSGGERERKRKRKRERESKSK